MSFYCKAAGCHYNYYHLTERHCCGKCNMTGHGQIECGNDSLIENLKLFPVRTIQHPCNIKGCVDPHTHTTRGHSCLYCDKRIERGVQTHIKYCPMNENTTENNSVWDNILEFNKDITENIEDVKLNIREYKKVYGGMGCIWFVRSIDGNDENNQYLFMHSDNWGQYGEETSHLPRYKAFIYKYNLVE